MNQEKAAEELNLEAYHTFGAPLLKILFGLTVFSLGVTLIYEFLI